MGLKQDLEAIDREKKRLLEAIKGELNPDDFREKEISLERTLQLEKRGLVRDYFKTAHMPKAYLLGDEHASFESRMPEALEELSTRRRDGSLQYKRRRFRRLKGVGPMVFYGIKHTIGDASLLHPFILGRVEAEVNKNVTGVGSVLVSAATAGAALTDFWYIMAPLLGLCGLCASGVALGAHYLTNPLPTQEHCMNVARDTDKFLQEKVKPYLSDIQELPYRR